MTKILYANEESWGFGPGGNETGVIAYELPADIAKAVRAQGVRYLADLAKDSSGSANWVGHYDEWHSTPMQLEGSDEHTNAVMSYEVSKYLNRYGFGIEIDQGVKKQINKAISGDGSFLAHGRIGVLIVDPSIQRVFYVYNG